MSDWESSGEENNASSKAAPKKAVKTKWEGEDEDEDEPASDWEESSEEEEQAATAVPAAPPKKKGTLKAKLAEKEALKAAQRANGDDDDYDSDDVLDPREKARRDREREIQADLNNAQDLLGSTSIGGTSSSELDSLRSFQPKTKEDFIELSNRIIELVIRRHENKPLYATFIEHHARALAMPLKDVEVRKVASGLTTLANEKQKEQRDKASGKKKAKGATKPGLGLTKPSSKLDTSVYEEALDDFGPDDFM